LLEEALLVFGIVPADDLLEEALLVFGMVPVGDVPNDVLLVLLVLVLVVDELVDNPVDVVVREFVLCAELIASVVSIKSTVELVILPKDVVVTLELSSSFDVCFDCVLE
jgi:hypothetical protein